MEIIKGDRRGGPKKIGELLVAAGVIRQEVLQEALQIAKQSSTPVGRVLMTIGELTDKDVMAAIEVQSMIRENLISSDFGVRALNLSIQGKYNLEDAFRRLGWTPPENRELVSSGELGELLLNAGIVEEHVLEDCKRQSIENNLPLGRCLVLSRVLSSNLLTSALTAQVLVRDGKITYEQAVMGLKGSYRKHQSIEKSLSEAGSFEDRDASSRIKVGDLLCQAGLITESDKVSAIERGLVDNVPIGQVLVQSGMVSPSALEETLKLQRLVNDGDLSSLQAAEILRQANSRGVPVEVVMDEKNARAQEIEEVNSIIDVIERAELMSTDELNRAKSLASQLKLSVGEVILSKELVDVSIVSAAVKGKRLMDEELITDRHLAKVLKMCKRNTVEFSEALKLVPAELPIDYVTDIEVQDEDFSITTTTTNPQERLRGKLK